MPELIMIVESAADFRIASDIANRIFSEKIEWIEGYLKTTFKWSGLEGENEFSCWRDIGKVIKDARNQGIRLPRFLGHNQKLKADGAIALRALQLIARLKGERDIAAVIFIRDLDNQPDRRIGLEQARTEGEERTFPVVVAIGTANCKREAWVLNGFRPSDTVERASLAEFQKMLTFDPTTESHRLRETTFQQPDRTRNAKVVLDELTKSDSRREESCWLETSLALLKERGIHSGLTDYMTEVEERLVPLLR